jgi:hypothetical protein
MLLKGEAFPESVKNPRHDIRLADPVKSVTEESSRSRLPEWIQNLGVGFGSIPSTT